MAERADLLEIAVIVLGLALNYKAWKRGFFSLPSRPHVEKTSAQPTLRHILSAFILFFLGSWLAAKFFTFISRHFLSVNASAATIQNLTSLMQPSALITSAVLLYLYFKKHKAVVVTIFKDFSTPEATGTLRDWLFGMTTWVLGFPLSAAAGMVAEEIVHLFHSKAPIEQAAVRYLKMSSTSAIPLTSALLTIIIAAPVIEEFLFRGLLQSYLKAKLGVKAAILLSSFFFAFFHASLSQGIDNISILTALFFFAIYLGFVYERKGSLTASIGLHMTFNAINTVRILFFSE